MSEIPDRPEEKFIYRDHEVTLSREAGTVSPEETFEAAIEAEAWAGNDDPRSREREGVAMIRHLIEAGPSLVNPPRSAEWKENAEKFLEVRKTKLTDQNEQLSLGVAA